MTYTHVRDLLGLFRNGYDTLEISYIAGLPEPTVYNQLHEQREAERLKAPKSKRSASQDWNSGAAYETNPKPQYRTRIPYAGKEKR